MGVEMRFEKLKINDAYIIRLNKIADDRGYFSRAWCQKEFEENGLEKNFVQANISFNKYKGTLRGMHYQMHPHQEVKLVRCIKGAIFDVIIDVRSDSPTFGQWVGAELTEENHDMLYVPKGFAHGFQTLQDNSEVFYQVSEFYTPSSENGIRFDDPRYKIDWPLNVSVISEKDATWPYLEASKLEATLKSKVP